MAANCAYCPVRVHIIPFRTVPSCTVPYITTHAFDAPSPLLDLASASSAPATTLGSNSSEFTCGGRYSLHIYKRSSHENQMLLRPTGTTQNTALDYERTKWDPQLS